jgi:O-antigen ligase
MIVEHPLIGIGFGNFDRYQEQFFLHPRVLGGLSITRRAEFWAGGTHNTWLTPVAELGVVAGGLYLILVLSGLFNALRRTTEASASTPPHGSWGAGLALCSFLTGVAFIVNSSLVELRYTLTPNAMFWVFMALAKTGPRYGPAAFAGRPLA